MFNKNLEALKLKNPELAQCLLDIKVEDISDIDVIEAQSEDLIISYKDIPLHSIIDPFQEAEKIWNKTIKYPLKNNDIQIVYGLGLGYLFKRAFANSGSKIILFEPFLQVLRFVLEHVDFAKELSENRVFFTNNIEQVVKKVESEYLSGDRIEFLFLQAHLLYF